MTRRWYTTKEGEHGGVDSEVVFAIKRKRAHLNFDELIVEGSDFVSDGAQQVLVGYGDVVPSASFEFSVPVKTDT